MPSHPDRVRLFAGEPLPNRPLAGYRLDGTISKQLTADIRALLDYIDYDYVRADMVPVIHRLRGRVG